MPPCLSRSVGLPPLFPTASVLRRTSSAAEMGSRSWRDQIKKTPSVENLQSLVEEEGNGSGALEDVWGSIQRKTEESEKPAPAAADVWGAILSQKKEGGDDVAPPPYVHPLVKRSASSLSEKSLEICTESLGSETGADGFSFSDSEKDDDVVLVEDGEMKVPRQQEKEVGPAVNFGGYCVAAVNKTKRAAAGGNDRSLPPPLPSLGHREDGSNLQMRCHRRDGRLVVEAVSVPSSNCFRAERQDGRLLLTFSEEEEAAEPEPELEALEIENECEREEPMMTMMKYVDYKFLSLTRNSPVAASWAARLNKAVPNPDDDDVAKSSPGPKPTGQIIPFTSSGPLNPYSYGWRSEGATVPETKEGFVGGGGCYGQPTRRSVLFWPDRMRCIATT